MRTGDLTLERAKCLRHEMTLPEVVLWQHVRRGRLEGRFRRQHPVGPYVLDFDSSKARLAVEVDGAGHGHPDRVRHDRARDSWLRRRGIKVLRFAAADVLNNDALEGVLARIAAAVASPGRAPSTTFGGPLPR